MPVDPLALAAAQIEITDKQRSRFLELLHADPQTGTVKALREAGVEGSRGQIRRLLNEDPDLAAEAREARGYGDNTIRQEITRRAIEGVEEEVFGSLGSNAGTGVVGRRRVYSDRLLGMMAKAYLPEYREKVEVTGTGGQPIPVEVAGGRVTGISDVFELARAVGVGLGEGLRTGAAREPLSAAQPVLPDPSKP